MSRLSPWLEMVMRFLFFPFLELSLSNSHDLTNFHFRLNKNRPEHTAHKTILPHDKWTRIVTIASVLFIIYYNLGNKHVVIMAKQDEVLTQKRFHKNLCSPAYKKEIEALGNKGIMILFRKFKAVLSEIQSFLYSMQPAFLPNVVALSLTIF